MNPPAKDNTIIPHDATAEIIEKMQPFRELMMKYQCVISEITTKFDVLSKEFSVRYNRNPIETIKTRLKAPLSIIDKLTRNNFPLTTDSIRENINDVAGIRIICSFPEDIYTLADMLLRQDDVKLIKRKDYIKNPKESGYRSLHLIVEVPIFLTESTELMHAEVQLRTIAMDFWAALEHKTRYKKVIKDEEIIAKELRDCAEQISALDLKMQEIHKYIQPDE